VAIGKRIGNNITISVDTAGGSSFTEIGYLVSVEGGELTRTDVNVSLLADTYNSYLPGARESGEFGFVVALDPNESGNQTLVTLYNRDATGTVPNWKIGYPTVANSTATITETFLGYVKSLGHTFGKDELIQRACTIKLTGEHGYTSS